MGAAVGGAALLLVVLELLLVLVEVLQVVLELLVVGARACPLAGRFMGILWTVRGTPELLALLLVLLILLTVLLLLLLVELILLLLVKWLRNSATF